MSLSQKLLLWQKANLIDNATAEKIKKFEKQNTKPVAFWAFGGLGAFAIILGLVSVVASNWLQTPDWVKLSATLTLCLMIALTLFRVISKESSSQSLWLREILVIVYYGFTLASMALIGQTYQLGGSIAQLFLWWTLVTIPIVLLGRGKFLSVLWIVGTSITYALNVYLFNDTLKALLSQRYLSDAIIVTLYIVSPFLFILLSRIPWLVKNRHTMSNELSRYSWLVIVIGGWLSHFLWYEPFVATSNNLKSLPLVIGFYSVATLLMVYFMPKLYASETKKTHLTLRVMLLTVFIMLVTALWHQQAYPAIGGVVNVIYLFVLAWAALNIQSIKLFNLITAIICLRLLFIYYEVYGSLFETGMGLVTGGVITLLVAWGWFKKIDTIAQYFGLSKPNKVTRDKT